MEITLSALLEGKPTIIKDKEFLSTKDYVQPFVDEMKKYTDLFRVNVQLADQISLSKDSKDYVYNRVWVQAIMPEKCDVNGYSEVYGLVYTLDSRVPVYKVYRAYMDKQTENLYVFDKDWLVVKELKPETRISYGVKPLMEKTSNFPAKIKKMKGTFLDSSKMTALLGEMVEKAIIYNYDGVGGKIKLASSDVVKAYTDVCLNSTSHYYVGPTVEGTMHNFYSAVCAQITGGKDIINRFEKTILVGQIIGINDESNKA